jgi:hypothetical protein
VNDYITALTGAGVWVAVGVTVFARLWVTAPVEDVAPTEPVVSGRHRRTCAADMVAELVPFEELMAYEDEFAHPQDTDPPRTWQWCPNDFRYESGALYPDGWICGHCSELAPVDSVTAGLGDAA